MRPIPIFPVWAVVGFSLLSACATPTVDRGAMQRLSAPYVEVQHQFQFASGAGDLSASERQGVMSFLNGLALTDSDLVIATLPGSGKPAVDAARKQMMQSLLSRSAAKVEILMEASFGARPTPRRQVGILRAVRAQGLAVSCASGELIADLGCASATNLAVMIHEPGDVLAAEATAARALRDSPAEGGQ
ncbi:CpaD family pilus assembly lipoprotein [Celeribacter sp. SCSIO 80788]|uniref:CpaD family pilus assembly lipoprotein n=1 Tax=Celeribacter sp. SCSIO 80788 TaxID=3117013 RepID=UPI003DA53C55